MAGACPAPAPGDPLVQGLLASTDCHVQLLVRSGYGALFEGSGGGGFSAVLTVLLTVYVAAMGSRLLLGRGTLNVSDLALTAVKLGVVVALATQWGTYQTVVYRLLFDGPKELADALLRALGGRGAAFGGDVFAGLQHAIDDLTAFSPAAPPGAPAPVAAPTLPPGLAAAAPNAAALPPAPQGGGLLSQSGFDSLLLMGSAVMLLLSSLGVLLAAKIVLGLLLALGPVFIALLLFDSTRGVFEGWLRASLGFAFAPLAVTVLLGLALQLLAPSLAEIEAMRDSHTYTPGVAFGVVVLVMVFTGVSAGLTLAAAAIAGGFRLPGRSRPAAASPPSALAPALADAAAPGRVARMAAAAGALERRDAALFAQAAVGSPGQDRRTALTVSDARARGDSVPGESRLGQEARRRAQPRAARAGTRAGARRL